MNLHRNQKNLRLTLLLAAVSSIAVGSSSEACTLHWMTGTPETASFWSATDILSAGTPADIAAAQLLANDAINSKSVLNSIGGAQVKSSAVKPAVSYASLDAIGAWKINWTGATGHSLNTTINSFINTIPSDVQSVYFDANYIYVKSTDVPSFNMGNAAVGANTGYSKNVNLSVRIPRNPTVATTNTSLGGGGVGVMTNGTLLFDPGDAQTYNNAGTWHRVANFFENKTFDIGPGHVAPGQGVTPSDSTPGTYHYHIGPTALTAQVDPGNTGQHHSPIIGFAYDGFPIYGPYGYTNPANANSPIKLLTSSYQIRPDLQTTGAVRQALTNGGATITNTLWGPTVGQVIGPNTYTAGCFKEDYMYTAGLGDLNNYNMRFEVTPEYPQGIWAYVMTMDAAGKFVFPYMIGPQYFGDVATGNTGAGGGNVTVPGAAIRLKAGDSNFDGNVSYADLQILAQNFGLAARGVWSQGNYDANGTIDAADLALLQSNYIPNTGSSFAADWTAAQAAVPEPTSITTLLIIGGGALLRRRRRAQ